MHERRPGADPVGQGNERVNPLGGSMATQLQGQIMQAIKAGMDLTTIEEQIIDPAPLDEDEKAALWLYAQALRERGTFARQPALAGS
jgi:hypothetical protein